MTPLVYTVENGHLPVVKYLVENDADVNAWNGNLRGRVREAWSVGGKNVLGELLMRVREEIS